MSNAHTVPWTTATGAQAHRDGYRHRHAAAIGTYRAEGAPITLTHSSVWLIVMRRDIYDLGGTRHSNAGTHIRAAVRRFRKGRVHGPSTPYPTRTRTASSEKEESRGAAYMASSNPMLLLRVCGQCTYTPGVLPVHAPPRRGPSNTVHYRKTVDPLAARMVPTTPWEETPSATACWPSAPLPRAGTGSQTHAWLG